MSAADDRVVLENLSPLINRNQAFKAPPPGLKLDNSAPELTQAELLDVFGLDPAVHASDLNKHLGEASNWTYKVALREALFALGDAFPKLAEDARVAIQLKLQEGIAFCSEGFFDRVRICIGNLINPATPEELVAAYRSFILEEAMRPILPSSYEGQEVHVRQRFYTAANQWGLGIPDPYASKVLQIYQGNVSEEIIQHAINERFEELYTPAKIVAYLFRSAFAERGYAKPKTGGEGYKQSVYMPIMQYLKKCFGDETPVTVADVTRYFECDYDSEEPDELQAVRAINWKGVIDKTIRHFFHSGFFIESHLTETCVICEDSTLTLRFDPNHMSDALFEIGSDKNKRCFFLGNVKYFKDELDKIKLEEKIEECKGLSHAQKQTLLGCFYIDGLNIDKKTVAPCFQAAFDTVDKIATFFKSENTQRCSLLIAALGDRLCERVSTVHELENLLNLLHKENRFDFLLTLRSHPSKGVQLAVLRLLDRVIQDSVDVKIPAEKVAALVTFFNETDGNVQAAVVKVLATLASKSRANEDQIVRLIGPQAANRLIDLFSDKDLKVKQSAAYLLRYLIADNKACGELELFIESRTSLSEVDTWAFFLHELLLSLPAATTPPIEGLLLKMTRQFSSETSLWNKQRRFNNLYSGLGKDDDMTFMKQLADMVYLSDPRSIVAKKLFNHLVLYNCSYIEYGIMTLLGLLSDPGAASGAMLNLHNLVRRDKSWSQEIILALLNLSGQPHERRHSAPAALHACAALIGIANSDTAGKDAAKAVLLALVVQLEEGIEINNGNRTQSRFSIQTFQNLHSFLQGVSPETVVSLVHLLGREHVTRLLRQAPEGSLAEYRAALVLGYQKIREAEQSDVFNRFCLFRCFQANKTKKLNQANLLLNGQQTITTNGLLGLIVRVTESNRGNVRSGPAQ